MGLHGTTIVCVRRGNQVAIGGDGQVSLGQQLIIKNTAHKLRQIGDIVAGFAGSTADAMRLFELIDNRVRQNPGQLGKICVSVARDMRSRPPIEAAMIVANPQELYMITGHGDVIKPDEKYDILSTGSGAPFAESAACALVSNTEMSAEEIVWVSMKIAAEKCPFTNDNIKVKVVHGK